MARDLEDPENEDTRDIYTLRPNEEEWLHEQELSDELLEGIYDKFHDKFETDDGRDIREFWRLLSRYQDGTRDYRAGIDRAMVTLTGYRLLSLMKMARGVLEEQL